MLMICLSRMASFDMGYGETATQHMGFTVLWRANNKNQTKNKQAKDRAKDLLFLLYFMSLTLKKSSHCLQYF